mmetsp:Transcript_19289/g.17110  ORF Transcript_19289/g.17110 Transcript_19289/m.17110 type:complete len:233 (-) Transcript_19289:34-732(-)
MYVYVQHPDIRRQRMVSKFFFHNDYSIINKNSVYSDYHSKGMTFKEKVKQRTSKEIVSILMQPKVRKKGTEFVVDVLKQPETKTAVVVLLKDVINDKKFIYHSTLWVTELLSKAVMEEPVIQSAQKLTENLLKQDGIVEETVQMLKYVTQRQEAMDIMSEYYKKVFKRIDVKNACSDLLREGAYQGLADPKTVTKFAHFMVKVVNTEDVRQGIFEAFVYKPVRNTFWFLYWK